MMQDIYDNCIEIWGWLKSYIVVIFEDCKHV